MMCGGQGEGGGARGGAGQGSGQGTRSTLYYIAALGVLTLGLSYAAVPLYRIFCQAYSYGGTTQQGHDAEKVGSMETVKDRMLKIRFNADTAASMTWNFRPQQREVQVYPGETALAFYTARNPTDRPVIGVSTYNVIPFDAGQNSSSTHMKRFTCQCSSTLTQSLPMIPKMENIDIITLSYTFFEAREGLQLPLPQFAR
ncbi:hypothetical protein O3P69_019232 [Scylla paramamosain]|uniref:Cytochrome c oxidase assembly protein COX11, mitochondrial n=1 Tax=Scylla paramamosain TaxID=85552 RepID=A0AAW0SX16_SCYPA